MSIFKKISITILCAICIIASLLMLNTKFESKQKVSADDGKFFYLSEFPHDSREYSDFYDMYAINAGFPVNGEETPLQLKVNGEQIVYKKGLCFQSNCKYSWDITSTKASRLTAKVGIQQRADWLLSSPNGATAQLEVKAVVGGQEQTLHTTKVLTFTDNAIDIDVQIPTSATKLILQVNDGGDGVACDNLTLGDAKLYANFMHLSDMTASQTSMGFGTLLYDNVLEGDITLLNVIREDSYIGVNEEHTKFSKNLFLHATSTADFDVSKMQATRFTAFVGITSTKSYFNGADGAIFRVYAKNASGELLGSTYYVYDWGRVMGKINFTIPSGTTTLTLEANKRGNDFCDHTMFCMPMIFGENLDAIKQISPTISNDSLTVGDEETVKLYATSYDNTVSEITNFTLSSADTTKATVNGKKVKAVGTGTVRITANYTHNTVSDSISFSVLIGSSTDSTYRQMTLVSPDGNTKISITRKANGGLAYSVTQNGKLFIEESSLGIQTSLADFSSDLTYLSTGTPKTINETYDNYSGKFLINTNYCTENDFTFVKNGHTFKVIARAYNDGVAFRYQISSSDGRTFTVSDETTTVNIPYFSKTWSSEMPTPDSQYFKAYTHEQPASEGYIASFTGAKVTPYLYKTPDDLYCLVSESDLDGSFWGSVLYSHNLKTVRFGRSVQQTTDLSVNGGIQTPWRVFIAGNLETIMKSNMIENLAPSADNRDWSWVEPGVASWSWMDGVNQFWDNGGDGKNGQTVNMKPINGLDYTVTWNWDSVVIGWQQNPEAIKMYIDLAAEMGWKYFILDDGWQPYTNINGTRHTSTGGIDSEPIGQYANFGKWYNGVFDWMTSKSQYWQGEPSGYTGVKIADYAASKGVKLIAWIHTGRIDTDARMNDVFGMLNDIGIAGIKVDFFDSESQWTIDLYNKLYDKTADNKLLGIFHGANKPTGERRTYPNIINREAIPGEELNNTKVYQQSIYAYLRGAIGPTDLTPYIYTVGSGDTNMASQMAFSIIYESGLTCFASTAKEYKALSTEVAYYYKNFPSRWADLKLISGEVGQGMTIARKAENNKWYIGAITVETKTETFDLSFLDSTKEYKAHIYTDTVDRKAVNYTTKTLTSQSSLTLTARENGGFVVVLEEIGDIDIPSSGDSGQSSSSQSSSTQASSSLSSSSSNLSSIVSSSSSSSIVSSQASISSTTTSSSSLLESSSSNSIISSQENSSSLQTSSSSESVSSSQASSSSLSEGSSVIASSSSELAESLQSKTSQPSRSARPMQSSQDSSSGGCSGSVNSCLLIALPILLFAIVKILKKAKD